MSADQTSKASVSNFSHLGSLDVQLARLGRLAERYFPDDPNTALLKLRQFGEVLAQFTAARIGIYASSEEKQNDLLRRLREGGILERDILNLFHDLRRAGNQASHAGQNDYGTALMALKTANQLGLWCQRTFGKSDFKGGPFLPPTPPQDESAELRQELLRLQAMVDAAMDEHQQVDTLRASMETRLRETAEERAVWESLAREAETEKTDLVKRLEVAQAAAAKAAKGALEPFFERSRMAAGHVELDEAQTRERIDAQLREVGWEADSKARTYASGTRPAQGVNQAIAEWPIAGRQAADYVLFQGLVPVAVVEAKRENVDVAGKISQAERYARGFSLERGLVPAWGESSEEGWPDGEGGRFRIPFVYSCNGRPYVKQLAEKSGTWFRDLRTPHNCARAHDGFHGPEGLADLLCRNLERSREILTSESFAYLGLRDYQIRAVQAVEQAIIEGRREMLLAMATGTGKTRTLIGLMYRLLKAERFRRILFLVDRTSLGIQAQEAFDDALLERNLPLSKVYNVALLGDMAPEVETRIQVATVQAMVKRLFHSDTPPGIDEYDCIVVDEAHRGYTLDQEMTDGEIEMRDASQYLSTYRRVLEHFDAVKVGLTATPAKHTTDIFEKPVFTYSYREAVAGDWLVDHEPPVRYRTILTENGIDFAKGEEVTLIRSGTGEVETAELEDDLHFDVEAFNRGVITEEFNRVICRELVRELDPFGEEKTLVFCANNLHADLVVRLLNETFGELYGDSYKSAAVQKITGSVDKVEECIRRFKNETFPNIAVTVDLLTTGIDVPKICNLVFLRRVKSRILYEQMKGRATRRCDEIGKTVFRIYDPVDLYASLEAVDTMKPLVHNPDIPLSQLFDELADLASRTAPGTGLGRSHADDVLDMVSQRLMRVLRRAGHKAQTRSNVRAKLDELETLWGVDPAKLHRHLVELGPDGAVGFLKMHGGLERQLTDLVTMIGSDRSPVISHHPDALVAKEQLTEWDSPDDYLESFEAFVRRSLNESVALSVVVNRPRDLTRKQLQELRLFLSENGYSEPNLKVAWRRKTNVEIAAGIVGFVRRAALGEELLPFAKRVELAVEKILSAKAWTTAQAKILDRLAKQLTYETVLDRDFVNQAFATEGGAKTLDIRLDKQLDEILGRLAESLWVA